MDALIVVGLLAVLAGPVLAIMALSAIRRLERGTGETQIQSLTTRLYSLEKQIAGLKHHQGGLEAGRAADDKPRAVGVQSGEVGIPEASELTPGALKGEAGAGEQGPKIPFPQIPPDSTTSMPPPALRAIASGQRAPAPGAPAEPRGASNLPLQGIATSQKSSPLDLESLIAGKWFNRIGIVAMLVAVSYFLKLAFDNNWIGPSGRVAIGVVLGAVMLPWSQWLLGKGYGYFSEGIAALGEATLFLSVWAGCQYYTLFSRDVGFAAMIAITAVMAAVAIGRDSQRIAVLSLLGGLLTPILASSGRDEQIVLFSYLLVLGAGTIAIEFKKDWKWLVPIAFLGTHIYFWGWYGEFYSRTSPLERTVVFGTLFFLLYAVLPIRTALQGLPVGEADTALVLLNAFIYSGMLFKLLWPDNRWPMTLFFLALAAGHVGVARMIRAEEKQAGTGRLLYAGLALAFLTLAIPIRLEGKWITLTFAVEGAILVWTGFKTASNFLRQTGYLLLAISALRLLTLPPDGGHFMFNPRFGAYVVMIACFGVASGAARNHVEKVAGQERAAVGIFAVAINLYALIALSVEFWDYFGNASVGISGGLAQHLSLSILWTAYATVLLVAGVQSRSALMRWQGLALFGIVVAKVFLYDLSYLERAYRILSFFVLGAVLLGVSFLYTRKLASQREDS